MTPRSRFSLAGAIARGVVMPFVLALSFAGRASAEGTWELQAAIPGPRWNTATAVDTTRGVLYLLGGLTEIPVGGPTQSYDDRNDLWEVELATGASRPMLTTGSPFSASPRGLIFDGERNQLVLVPAPGVVEFLPLATREWNQPTYPAGPVVRGLDVPSVILDAARDRLLMWGPAFGDSVWSFSLTGDGWEYIPAAGGHPPLLADAPACFDPVRDRMLVYINGGVWALTLFPAPTWSQLPVGPPSPTTPVGGYVFMDVEGDRMIRVGEFNFPWGTGCLEVSALPFSGPLAWQVLRPYYPGIINRPSIAFDPRGRSLVSFGGVVIDRVSEGGGWTYDYYYSQQEAGRFQLDEPPDWATTSSFGLPHPISDAVVFDAVNQRLVVVDGTYPARTYEMPVEDAGPLGFREIGTAGTLPALLRPHLIADVAHDRLVLLEPASGPIVQMSMPLHGPPEWSPLASTGTPPGPRNGSSAVYDARAHRIVLFGGDSAGVYMRDTFILTLDGTPNWTRLSGPAPPARTGHVAVYDPQGERMIVFGGSSGGLRNDTWELSLGETPHWSPMAFDGLVPILPRVDATAVLDAAGRRMLVYGGRTATHARDDLWALPLDTTEGWQQVNLATPSARSRAVSTYDPTRRQWWMLGGETYPAGATIREVWTFTDPSLLDVGRRPGSGQASFAFALPSPNPSFGPVTLTFTLAAAADVRLEVFDVAGRVAGVQAARRFGAGTNTIRWAPADGRGRLAPGLYLFRLEAAGIEATRRVLIVR